MVGPTQFEKSLNLVAVEFDYSKKQSKEDDIFDSYRLALWHFRKEGQ